MTAPKKVSVKEVVSPMFEDHTELNKIFSEVFKLSVQNKLTESVDYDSVKNVVLSEGENLGFIIDDSKFESNVKELLKGFESLPKTFLEVERLASELSSKYYKDSKKAFNFLKMNWIGSFPEKVNFYWDNTTIDGQCYQLLINNPELSIEAFAKEIQDKAKTVKNGVSFPLGETKAKAYRNKIASNITACQSYIEVHGSEAFLKLFK